MVLFFRAGWMYPVGVHLYAVVQDLCGQLSFAELWPQEGRLNANALARLLSAQVPAKSTP